MPNNKTYRASKKSSANSDGNSEIARLSAEVAALHLVVNRSRPSSIDRPQSRGRQRSQSRSRTSSVNRQRSVSRSIKKNYFGIDSNEQQNVSSFISESYPQILSTHVHATLSTLSRKLPSSISPKAPGKRTPGELLGHSASRRSTIYTHGRYFKKIEIYTEVFHENAVDTFKGATFIDQPDDLLSALIAGKKHEKRTKSKAADRQGKTSGAKVTITSASPAEEELFDSPK